MPNRNYLAGRRFEYDTIDLWRSKGYKCIRASGSHGEYDVIAYLPNHKPIFIQCKVVTKESDKDRLLREFDPIPSKYYHQQLSVKVKGDNTPSEVTV